MFCTIYNKSFLHFSQILYHNFKFITIKLRNYGIYFFTLFFLLQKETAVAKSCNSRFQLLVIL